MLSFIGYIAALCGTIQLIPEVLKASKTHHLQDVSWATLFLMVTSSILWGIYGISIGDIPIMISSTTNIVMECALILMKRQYQLTGKPLKHFIAKKRKSQQTLQPAFETETIENEQKAPAKGL